MARNIQLLLTENVDNLGIVGDVVNVRTGYARNFLLPRQFATKPSEEAIKALASKRAAAEKLIAEQRAQRAALAKKLEGFELTLIRSCNDMGILYGAVTQHEISKALHDKGHEVRPRDVRIPHAIKRIDKYDIHIKFESDLEANIVLHVRPDRKLDIEDQHAEPAAPAASAAPADTAAADAPAAEKPKKAAKEKAPAKDAEPAAEPKEKKAKKAKKE